MVEIYPREGTETDRLQSFPIELRVEIYPREGTETRRARRSCCRCSQSLKFIPERGRKRLDHRHHSHVRVEIYPREGTETQISLIS